MAKCHSIGIVGAGRITENMHLPVLANIPDAQLVWITDLERPRAGALGRAFGIPAVDLPEDPGELPPCDAALLAIPLRVRTRYYEAFSARGTAVMAEKPFASDVEEHRRILDAFAPHRIGCGFQRRNYESTLTVRQTLREAWFGPPRSIRIREGGQLQRSGTDASYADDVRLAGGGVLLGHGCHALDWALYVTGATDYEISECHFVFDEDLDRKVSARIKLFAGEGTVELDYCVSWLDRQANRIEIGFENVELSLGISADSPIQVKGRGSAGEPAILRSELRGATTPNQAFFLEWSQFLEGLDTAVPSRMSAAAALQTTSIIEDLYRAGCGS